MLLDEDGEQDELTISITFSGSDLDEDEEIDQVEEIETHVDIAIGQFYAD